MSKPMTTETAAKLMTEVTQPGLTFDSAANIKQAVPPVKTELPAPLAKALGQRS